MHVEIYRLSPAGSVLAGLLRLEDGAIVAEPAESRLLANIQSLPLYDPRSDRVLTAEDTPEDFLRHLHMQYSSAYLRAGKAIEEEKI